MFFIVCFEHLPESNDMFLNTGDVRAFGYFDTFEKAEQSLNNNTCDMNETIYDYAVVEEIEQGIHPYVESKHCFKFDRTKNGFFEIEIPNSLKNYPFSFIIG